MKIGKTLLIIFSFLVLAVNILYAQEITILYTGQTHAMLYPCSCPIQQDGGVARRAILVKELRKKDSGLLLLDCGNFTAGGLMDEYTQSVQLDMQRSEVNYKSMELMKYDAVGIGSDEFNFGKEFFLKNAKKAHPAYLSANLDTDSSPARVLPYIIKDVNGVKIGIIGLTSLAAHQKTEGLKINTPAQTAKLISRLKTEGVQIIILLSTLGEQEDLKLISQVKGIDILFIGQNPLKQEALTKIDTTFILRPFWQGRKLGKLSLGVKDGLLVDCKLDELRLSENIADDADIDAILPRCYSDSNCKKEALVGSCQNPGTLKASCSFKVPNKVSLLVISVKDCAVCNAEPVINSLKKKFPGIEAWYIYYPDPEAQKKVRELSIQGLPAYIFDKEIEKEDGFANIKNDFLQIGDDYMLKPQASGLAYLLNRKIKKGTLDLFVSLFENDASGILAVMQEFKPDLHFLAVENGESFAAKNGAPEVEEYLRGVCVQKYYPQKFWDYLICRSKNISSSYWEDCLGDGTGPLKVKSCARGPEGAKLLKQNIGLNKEIQVFSGPLYLLDNHEIFSSRGVPAKEDLKRIIKK
ncbi:MAG: hypothetical protein PHG87_03355 [Candidatus Omnitrophica bacterium]|nr:hypothetical protein [Candidatus Omnitrophota bacterium]